MRAVDLIIKKRGNNHFTKEEMHYLITEYVNNNIPDYQMSALLMAIFFNGLSDEELFYLTNEMINSGDRLDFSGIDGVKVDKHSTGGVGDKVSLIIAPILAAAGCIVPMMSGRGLGHTGGTLDKLESIPGFKVHLTKSKINEILTNCGYVMMGQTEKIVPADKKLYALRDVTGTIESIPLIASSIMSKKIAEGTDALVMDIKCGKGAFMKNIDAAKELGNKIISIGRSAGKKIAVLITNMDQPLGNKIGNYLEVIESIDCLLGNGPEDLMTVSIELAAKMIVLGGKAKNINDAKKLACDLIKSKKAYECFLKNVELQGGDLEYLKEYKLKTKYEKNITAEKSGYLEELHAYHIGIASTVIGAGRQKKEDVIDYACGIVLHKKVGDKVKKGENIATLYYNSNDNIPQSVALCNKAIKISDKPVKSPQIILDEMG